MNKKNLLVLFLISSFIGSFLVINAATIPVVATTPTTSSTNSISSLTANTWTNITGTNISYRYGLDTFDAHDSFQVNSTGVSVDTYTENRVQSLSMDLVNLSSIHIQKIVYKIIQTAYITSTQNQTDTFTMDNNTYPLYIDQINSTVYNNLSYVSAYNPTFSTADVAIVTTNNDYLGTFPTNVTFLELSGVGSQVNITHILIPVAYVVTHTPIKNVQVTLNSTLSVSAAFFYANYYNVTYNIHAEQWSTQIRDGDRMGMYMSAFKDLQMNYTEIRATFMTYYIQSSLDVNLTYANGTYVPFENYPFALRPALFQQNGTIEDVGVRFINTTSLVASTTAVQAFHTKLAGQVQNAHVNASSFVAWMVGSTPRLLAYKDVNLNGQLDLSFDPSVGLQQSSGDFIPYVGVMEATSGDAISVQNTTQVYDQHIFTLQGFQVINQTNKGVTENNFNYNTFHYGVGDVNSPPTFNTYFNTPVNNSGTFVFSFGVDYQNFPVTWVDMQNGNTVTSPMNISYDYVYEINPYTGNAKLSPTITYGAVSPSLQTTFSGLSLATMYESDFMSYQSLTASRVGMTNKNVTSSQATNFASISFSGPQNQFTSVDAGSKANYTLDGVQHTTKASVLNLVSFQATAASGNVTVFQSDSQSVTSTAMMQNATVSYASLQYRKDLILVSYPQWGGGKIVHDPSFSTVYQPNPATPKITSAPVDQQSTVGNSLVLKWGTYDADNNGKSYQITEDSSTVVSSGNWASGDTISTTITVKEGTHTYTLTITDQDGNTATSTVTITGVQGSSTGTSTAVVSTSSNNSSTAAPGFTIEMLLFLSVISLVAVYNRKKKLN